MIWLLPILLLSSGGAEAQLLEETTQLHLDYCRVQNAVHKEVGLFNPSETSERIGHINLKISTMRKEASKLNNNRGNTTENNISRIALKASNHLMMEATRASLLTEEISQACFSIMIRNSKIHVNTNLIVLTRKTISASSVFESKCKDFDARYVALVEVNNRFENIPFNNLMFQVWMCI